MINSNGGSGNGASGGLAMSKRYDGLPQNELEIRRLWQRRPENMRNNSDIDRLMFYSWLEKEYPSLVPESNGDPYQVVSAIIEAYEREHRPY
jgi:hypothetical protein